MLFKINTLRDYRYSITKPHNEVRYAIFTGQGLQPDMSTTYKTLIEEHQKRLKSASSSASIDQVVKNHNSALRGFLKTMEKSESSPVGAELADDFEACQRRHIAASSLGARAVSDRRSLLNAWKLTFDLMGVGPVEQNTSRERRFAKDWPTAKQNPFEMALRAGLQKARLTAKSAARRSGVSSGALGRWTRGALPNIRSTESLKKLETTLGLTVGSLSVALDQATARVAASVMDLSRIQRGERF